MSEQAPPDESLGEVKQELGGPCYANRDCPLGQSCDLTTPHLPTGATGTCRSFFVVGPTPRPCVDSEQCYYQYSTNSYCDIAPGASYGSCQMW